ncbi:prepilin-type N-terminal cleavage/methylation domain-containing protein [Methylobacterium gregans]|uniref:General secretion pathway protein H n=1 Tax=Methylobacterium gregans TaxID=374424 RepID=A0AA37HPX4_9HYPH|nr:prepilin-type N-terminal cleavage/methylation domain-containing protein [Methylobacterium gregans]MDQ0521838.1 general secretion pathway protein H [Methylobacterium gregans]GJD79496.1 hypothetical protein NBEOAGPD_2723 [Methylobacterium gregans]GLS52095.1 hypothetical protein GCM10007886_02770 [Methylobacterium gregans]
MPGQGARSGSTGADRDLRPGAGGTAGFTLVEMLVTLAVLALALTLASRSLGGMPAGQRPARLSGAIAAEIGLLRAEALRTGRSASLVFDAAGGRFLSSRPGAGPIAAPLHVTVEAAGGEPGEIRLLPDGSSTGGRIVLRDAAAQSIVSVSALTGRVRRDEPR